jgi:hypothetical protein
MIDWLVNKLFWYTPLRQAIFAEVHMYDMIEESLKDTTPGSGFWNDGDGWRSWTYSPERNKYYFNDIPEEDLGSAMRYTLESKGPEFDMDEVW